MENKLKYEELQAQNLFLSEKIIAVTLENEDLKKEQKEFQDVLIAKIKEIKESPKMWRWLKYGQLLTDLIDTIFKAIAKVNSEEKSDK